MDGRPAEVAAESLPAEVASLDATGIILWANEAWLRAARARSGPLAGCTIGVDVISTFRAAGTESMRRLASGIETVIGSGRGRFETELVSADGARRWRFQASPLRGAGAGAVLICTEVTAGQRQLLELPDAGTLPGQVERLTPRERDVLGLMVQGNSNREIAAQLGIGYTTVRGYVQSVIEKLGARSRLQAVARVIESSRAVEAGGTDMTVQLGIGEQDVRVPAHVGVFYDGEADRRRIQRDVLQPALDDPRQAIVLIGAPGLAAGMLRSLEEDIGRSLDRDISDKKVAVMAYESDPDHLLEVLRDTLVAVSAKHPIVRVFADVKWGSEGSPLPEDALWVESRVNDLLADTAALVVCAYDVSELPDQALNIGALQAHPHVVIGDRFSDNPSYLAPPEYMRVFLLQMRPPPTR